MFLVIYSGKVENPRVKLTNIVTWHIIINALGHSGNLHWQCYYDTKSNITAKRTTVSKSEIEKKEKRKKNTKHSPRKATGSSRRWKGRSRVIISSSHTGQTPISVRVPLRHNLLTNQRPGYNSQSREINAQGTYQIRRSRTKCKQWIRNAFVSSPRLRPNFAKMRELFGDFLSTFGKWISRCLELTVWISPSVEQDGKYYAQNYFRENKSELPMWSKKLRTITEKVFYLNVIFPTSDVTYFFPIMSSHMSCSGIWLIKIIIQGINSPLIELKHHIYPFVSCCQPCKWKL